MREVSSRLEFSARLAPTRLEISARAEIGHVIGPQFHICFMVASFKITLVLTWSTEGRKIKLLLEGRKVCKPEIGHGL